MLNIIVLFFAVWLPYLLHRENKRAQRAELRKVKLEARRVTLYGGRAV
jgi:hypothetical protein